MLVIRDIKVCDFLSAFRRFDNTNEVHSEALRQLYTWLIFPLKPQLKTPIIGIVRHGMLHYLPFAALIDGTNYLSAPKISKRESSLPAKTIVALWRPLIIKNKRVTSNQVG